MGFLTNLLGSENAYVTAILALGIVLVLIVGGVWLLKAVSDASRSSVRGRSRRLGVVDSVPLDQRRQAVLLRRDNVEHLIITGGPHDLLVETMIVPPPAQPARQSGRNEPPREQRTEPRGRVDAAPPIGPSRQRQVNSPRQRVTLRNTGVLGPVSPGEPLPAGGIGQNGIRRGSDSANAQDRYGDGDQDSADYQTVDIDSERDGYAPGDGRRGD